MEEKREEKKGKLKTRTEVRTQTKRKRGMKDKADVVDAVNDKQL